MTEPLPSPPTAPALSLSPNCNPTGVLALPQTHHVCSYLTALHFLCTLSGTLPPPPSRGHPRLISIRFLLIEALLDHILHCSSSYSASFPVIFSLDSTSSDRISLHTSVVLSISPRYQLYEGMQEIVMSLAFIIVPDIGWACKKYWLK